MSVSLSPSVVPAFDSSQADVVVVGAGPVGLWTSIIMKAIDSTLNVVVLDKYTEYKRDNPLLLERSSFADLPQHDKVRALVDELFTKNGKKLTEVHINTNDIEKMFLQAAQGLGVHVQRGGPDDEVKTVEQLGRFKKARVIVGADGAKSQMREQLFGKLASDNDLQYIAQVKYTTEAPKPERTKTVKKIGSMKLVGGHVAEAPKNPQVDAQTGTMNLLFTVNNEIFEKIKDATFKEPRPLEQCPKTLRERALHWINARKDQAQTQKTVQVSSIKLNSYKSRDFVKFVDAKAYGLVGDAAFGVPYFRSLNNGITCGTRFAQAAVNHKNGNSQSMKDYNRFVHKFANWEMCKAKAKSLAVRGLDIYINVMGWLPRKAIAWHENFLTEVSGEYSG